MEMILINNSGNHYSKCTHYLKNSGKRIKSMRIASKILGDIFPNCNISYCESMFPNFDSKFIVIKKLGVNIVCEKSTIHDNRIYFSFFV